MGTSSAEGIRSTVRNCGIGAACRPSRRGRLTEGDESAGLDLMQVRSVANFPCNALSHKPIPRRDP